MKNLILPVVIAILVLLGSSMFTVREDQYAVLFLSLIPICRCRPAI